MGSTPSRTDFLHVYISPASRSLKGRFTIRLASSSNLRVPSALILSASSCLLSLSLYLFISPPYRLTFVCRNHCPQRPSSTALFSAQPCFVPVVVELLSVSSLSPLVFLVNASPQAIPLSPQPRNTMLLSLIMYFWWVRQPTKCLAWLCSENERFGRTQDTKFMRD